MSGVASTLVPGHGRQPQPVFAATAVSPLALSVAVTLMLFALVAAAAVHAKPAAPV